MLPDPTGIRVEPKLDSMKEKYEAKKGNDGEPKVRKPRAPKQPKKPKEELDEVGAFTVRNHCFLDCHLNCWLSLTRYER